MKVRDRIAWNLRATRAARGVSQEHLAVDAGVDRTTVSALENGGFNASIDLLEKLASALGVDVGVFFEVPPSDQPPPAQLRPGRKPGK